MLPPRKLFSLCILLFASLVFGCRASEPSAAEAKIMKQVKHKITVGGNDTHCRFTFPDGKTEEHRFRAGETPFTPAGSHLPENLSNQPIDLILVELKR